MSGLFSAVMIGLGRAVGETMIVLMAAGNTPIMDWNVFNGFRTLSAQHRRRNARGGARTAPHYRMLFLAALCAVRHDVSRQHRGRGRCACASVGEPGALISYDRRREAWRRSSRRRRRPAAAERGPAA